MSRTILSLAVSGLLLALGLPAESQQAAKVPRIGFMSATGDPQNPGVQLAAFRQGLRNLGYIEGKSILVEYRYAEGNQDRIPGLVAELVLLNVEVLVVGAQASIRAAKQATKTIPIVMVSSVDPVTTGLVDSLARPGGNITGLARLTRDLSGKRLELLKEVAPGIKRVGVLRVMNDPASDIAFKEYQTAAGELSIQLQALEVQRPTPDFEAAFHTAGKGHVSALITIRNPLFSRYPKPIADLAIKNRLPAMYEGSDYVEAGGLMSYASDDVEQWRRAAYYVDRILKGTKPAELPVEQPMKSS